LKKGHFHALVFFVPFFIVSIKSCFLFMILESNSITGGTIIKNSICLNESSIGGMMILPEDKE